MSKAQNDKTYSKEYEERMTDDLGMRQLTEEDMVCVTCKYREGQVLSCGIYAQKPDPVTDGEACSHYEEAK